MLGIGGLRLSEELNPCPFCGGKAKVIIGYLTGGYVVSCTHCWLMLDDEQKSDVSGRFEPFDTEQEAISAWNNLH